MKEIYRKTDAIEFDGDPISYVVYQLENGFYQVEYYSGTEFYARSKFRIEEAVDWEKQLDVFNAEVGLLHGIIKGQILVNGKWVDSESFRRTE
jgi:hypothetical protein